MADFLIKNFPDKLRRRLKADAKQNHRSMSGQALAILEKSLFGDIKPMRPVKAFKLNIPLTDEILAEAKKGRA